MERLCPYYYATELARAVVEERFYEASHEVLPSEVQKEVETRKISDMDKESPIKEFFAYVARAF